MHIFVGSTNPVKINAVTIAASETWPEVEVVGCQVDSGVSEQPKSDEETKQGAVNRAKAALDKGLKQLAQTNKVSKKANLQQEYLGVGLEGGIFTNDKDEMWTTVWSVVVDSNDQMFMANGARFPVPDIVAKQIYQGKEMGPVMAQFFNGRPVKKQEGMIGVVTQYFVDRTEEYSTVAKMALGQWYGRDWQKKLQL